LAMVYTSILFFHDLQKKLISKRRKIYNPGVVGKCTDPYPLITFLPNKSGPIKVRMICGQPMGFVAM